MAQIAPHVGDMESARPVSVARLGRARRLAAAVRSRTGTVVETDIPERLDSLPFGRFHFLVIVALGVT
jgi:hypothetical protein